MSESFVAHFELIETRLLSKAEIGPQSPITQTPVPNKILENSIQNYIDNLSDSDKTAFKAAPDVLEHLRSLQRNNKGHISSFVTHRVDQILQVLKIFTGTRNSEQSNLVLGGVHCIFTVGSSAFTSEPGN